MTSNDRIKKQIRKRMSVTEEPYSVAKKHVEAYLERTISYRSGYRKFGLWSAKSPNLLFVDKSAYDDFCNSVSSAHAKNDYPMTTMVIDSVEKLQQAHAILEERNNSETLIPVENNVAIYMCIPNLAQLIEDTSNQGMHHDELVFVMTDIARKGTANAFYFIALQGDIQTYTPLIRLFEVVGDENDPSNYEALMQPALFGDYEDKIQTPETIQNLPDMNWSPGILKDGTPLMFRVMSNLPKSEVINQEQSHLLISGGTKENRTAVIRSMISQLSHKNDEHQIEFWKISDEELNELTESNRISRYAQVDPNNSTSDELIFDAFEELQNRKSIFVHQRSSGKRRSLLELHLAAKEESENNGTPITEHPMYLPQIVIIIESDSFMNNGSLASILRQSRIFNMVVVAAVEDLEQIPYYEVQHQMTPFCFQTAEQRALMSDWKTELQRFRLTNSVRTSVDGEDVWLNPYRYN